MPRPITTSERIRANLSRGLGHELSNLELEVVSLSLAAPPRLLDPQAPPFASGSLRFQVALRNLESLGYAEAYGPAGRSGFRAFALTAKGRRLRDALPRPGSQEVAANG